MILFNGNIHIYNTYIMERSRCRQTKWDGYGDEDVVREVAKFLDQYKWPTEWKTTSGRIIPIKTQYGNIVVLYCVVSTTSTLFVRSQKQCLDCLTYLE